MSCYKTLANQQHNHHFISKLKERNSIEKSVMEDLHWICQQLLLLAVILAAATVAAATAPPTTAQALPHCPDHCGDLSIPFPFGTKDGCYLNENFLITCNASNVAFQGITSIEVLDISLEGQLRISTWPAYDCYDELGNQTRNNESFLKGSNFRLSYTQNKLTAVGCDTFAIVGGKRGRVYTTGCISFCDQTEDVTNGSCAGIGCCQSSIPKGVWDFSVEVGSFYNHQYVPEYNPCSFAFVVEETKYNFSTLDLADLRKVENFPVLLDWTIGNQTCNDAQQRPETYACKDNSICYDPDNGPGYRCNCSKGYSGNPYLVNSCQGKYVMAWW